MTYHGTTILTVRKDGRVALGGEQHTAAYETVSEENLPGQLRSGASIVQQLRGGSTGWVYRPDTEIVSMGREGNDINFPDDPFISGRHAQLQLHRHRKYLGSVSLASSVDGGVFFNFALDPAFELDRRIER